MSAIQDAFVSTMSGLFSHGPTPLENTMAYEGDPGLLGPDCVSWRVIGDSAVFVGGIRALVVQATHAEVVAGVEDHSTYRTDPLGRLSRTAAYVTETTYGAMPEVEAAVQVVRRAHQPVHGTSERNKPYSASKPEMAAWVHNVLTDSFLRAYQAFGPEPLTEADADRFVVEQTKVGALLGADPMPETSAELQTWILDHPDRVRTNGQVNAVSFLRKPPLSPPVKVGYRLLFEAAATTIPEELRDQLGLDLSPRSAGLGGRLVQTLRWALGASPTWKLALVRSGAPIPPNLFKQPTPSGRIDPDVDSSGKAK